MLKTLFRFPEINLGFVTSAWGAGHLTPKKSLGREAFDQRKGPHGGEFGGGGGGREGMGTLGFDSYIISTSKYLAYIHTCTFATCMTSTFDLRLIFFLLHSTCPLY